MNTPRGRKTKRTRGRGGGRTPPYADVIKQEPSGSGESSGGGKGSHQLAPYPAIAHREPAPAPPIQRTCSRSLFPDRSHQDSEIGAALHDSGSEEEFDEEEGEGDDSSIVGSNFQLLRYFRGQERERLLDAENAALEREIAEKISGTSDHQPQVPVAEVKNVGDFEFAAASGPASPLAGEAMPEVAAEAVVVSGTFEWSEDYTTFSGVRESYTRVPGPTIENVNPYELFCFVWDDEILNNIAIQTNIYAWQTIAPLFEGGDVTSPHSRFWAWCDTDVCELRRFFSILIYMSLDYRSRLDEYWSTGILGMPEFRSIMNRDRFLILLKFIHFVDNITITEAMDVHTKKLAKITPIVDHCNAKFQQMYVPNRELSLDESLLLWKGNSLGMVQCIRTKAARFGIKSFDLCEGESGYLLKTILYTGRDTSTGGHDEIRFNGFENSTAKVVLKLMNGYLDVGHALYMDNWYNQMPLTRFLKAHKTDVVGTQSRRRLHVPNAIKEVTQRTLEPGQMIWRHCGDINMVVWHDVKLVAFVSTFHPKDTAHGQRASHPVEKPSMVNDYNRYMGGVDQKDQMLSMYLMERKRSTKWYLKVFRRCMNSSLLNGFIIQKTNLSRAGQRYLTHRQFRFAVAEQLVRHNRVPNVVRPIVVAAEARLSGRHDVDHTPLVNSQRQRRRCVRCSAKGKRRVVKFMCIQCDVGLCLGRCFREYHTVANLARVRPSD